MNLTLYKRHKPATVTVLDLYITFNFDHKIDSFHFISNGEYPYPFLLRVSNGWVWVGNK